MLKFFGKAPKNANREFSDLSLMLVQDLENRTYKRELLDAGKLDFSVESLRHIDKYLESLHTEPPKEKELVRVVLRCGAYVGEVIRKNSPNEINWVAFEEAAKYSDFVKGLGRSLGTAGILWTDSKKMYFPLAKICKFIENGSEDSVYFLASVILKGPTSNKTGPS